MVCSHPTRQAQHNPTSNGLNTPSKQAVATAAPSPFPQLPYLHILALQLQLGGGVEGGDVGG
jgi:hypothetical protein